MAIGRRRYRLLGSVRPMADEILEVDLLAFEQGSAEQRRAVVDGLVRSLATGFVYVTHDVSNDLIDEAYEARLIAQGKLDGLKEGIGDDLANVARTLREWLDAAGVPAGRATRS